MIMMIILRFGLLLLVFMTIFPSHIEKKFIFILTFALATPPPLFKGARDPQVGKH